jgi:hypothetical protein
MRANIVTEHGIKFIAKLAVMLELALEISWGFGGEHQQMYDRATLQRRTGWCF